VIDNPTPSGSSATEPTQALEAEIDAAISICGGDVRGALRAALLANAFLEAEIERLSEAVSAGFARGRVRRRASTLGTRTGDDL
jgi:hypothetical protein